MPLLDLPVEDTITSTVYNWDIEYAKIDADFLIEFPLSLGNYGNIAAPYGSGTWTPAEKDEVMRRRPKKVETVEWRGLTYNAALVQALWIVNLQAANPAPSQPAQTWGAVRMQLGQGGMHTTSAERTTYGGNWSLWWQLRDAALMQTERVIF